MKLQKRIRSLACFILLPVLLLAQATLRETISTFPETVQDEERFTLPQWNIKTNLLYDATATLNLGLEFRIGNHTSLDIPFNYNAWTFRDDRKWKHFLVQPEWRWWTKETFDGHFFGLHGHYALYNVGNLPHDPFSSYLRDYNFKGWLAGVGVSYGYRWDFNRYWAMEATIGAGYAYFSYDKYECGRCGQYIDSKTKHYFGPTKVGLSLILGIGGKPAEKPQHTSIYITYSAPTPEPEPEPELLVLVPPYEPTLYASFVTPEAEAVKARSASGKAYLDFVVGRSEIVPGFRNNAAELQKIHTMVESVENNPDVTLTGITITGYASPEGTSASNQSLSERRAQALKNHIRNFYGLREELFTVYGIGEDWSTLDTLVDRSYMPDKYSVLEIIRGTNVPDARDAKLVRLSGGGTYRQIKTELFPQLRRSDYSIRYTIAPFTIEQSKEVFRSRPGNLSLNEMFLIANTYQSGSDAFNEVFETAAHIFPDSDTASINAAASALNRKDAISAARYLGRVKEHTSAYWNNIGMLAWLQGDKPKAAECFAKGGEQAKDNAAELHKHIQSMNE